MADGLKIRISPLDNSISLVSPIEDMQIVSFIIVDAIQKIAKHEFTRHPSSKEEPYVEFELNPNFVSNQPNSRIFREISTNQDANSALDMLCNLLKSCIANKIAYVSFGNSNPAL